MKKLILASLVLSTCLFAKDVFYSTVVKPVYLDETSKVIAGKLLPTNAIEILDRVGNRVKFSIEGYQNPAVSNVIYFSSGQRILSLAFAKTKSPKFEIIKNGENGEWNKVKVVAYTDDGDFTKNLDENFAKSKKLYTENCSICHALHKPSEFQPNQWPALFKSMLSRTPIDKKDEWSIIQYLQKHGQNMQKETK